MRRVPTTLLIACLIVPAASRAQEGSGGSNLDGKWALQFQITHNFTLDAFQGSVLSAKYHSSAQNAWRAGLGFEFDSSTSERTTADAGVEDPPLSSANSQQAVQLDLQYLRYANPDAKVQFLFGGGPLAGYGSRSSEGYEDGVSRGRQENDRWNVGVSGVLGVEWFVASRVSIHAEYGVEFVYAKTTVTTKNDLLDTEGSQDTEGWGIGPRDVLFGVSAYF